MGDDVSLFISVHGTCSVGSVIQLPWQYRRFDPTDALLNEGHLDAHTFPKASHHSRVHFLILVFTAAAATFQVVQLEYLLHLIHFLPGWRTCAPALSLDQPRSLRHTYCSDLGLISCYGILIFPILNTSSLRAHPATHGESTRRHWFEAATSLTRLTAIDFGESPLQVMSLVLVRQAVTVCNDEEAHSAMLLPEIKAWKRNIDSPLVQ